jgi:hypothetical protein
MAAWPTTLRIGSTDLKLLVTSPEGEDRIKARLPLRSDHPRALLTLLEGVALWSGQPLCAVISAACRHPMWPEGEPWGNYLFPAESALVHFDFASDAPRVRRPLRGIGDFRDMRRDLRLVGSR